MTDRERETIKFLVADCAEVRALLMRAAVRVLGAGELVAHEKISIEVPLTDSIDDALSALGAFRAQLNALLMPKPDDVSPVDS